MIAISYYLLKVIICSGILYGYYHLALRDKLFHQWNRFYLMGVVPVSLLLPLVEIHIQTTGQTGSTIITALQMVSGADEYIQKATAEPSVWLSGAFLSALAYILVSLMTLGLFIAAVHRIKQMIRRNQAVAFDDFTFLNTREPGTPFSYFRFLLWNQDIPLNSDSGQRILEHELVHIREKHSWDKLFIQCILVVCWVNPFFWLIRRELTLVHEFIADRKTVGNGDAHALAKLLLETSFPGYAPMMTNAFFTSSIKRRIAMTTKKQHPGLNYFSRLMMIPVLFVLLFTFGLKAKTMLDTDPAAPTLDKPVTVVIDAGHGGDDTGARNGEAVEKNLNLEIAQLIRKLNTNKNIQIVLSRTTDVLQPLPSKVDIAKQQQADLFISVHINSSANAVKTGIEAVVSGKLDNQFQTQNTRLATLMLKNLSTVYATDLSIKKREQGVYVLDKNVCPAVIVEMGYLTNRADYQFISSKANQEKLAQQVLTSIEQYFDPNMLVLAASNISQPLETENIKAQVSRDTSIKPRIEVRKNKGDITIQNGQVTQGTMTISTDTILITGPVSTATKKSLPKDVTYTIDGKPSYPAAVEALQPQDIHSISVNKGRTPTDKGSIDIVTKAGLAKHPELGKPSRITSVSTPITFSGTTVTTTNSVTTSAVDFTGVTVSENHQVKPVDITITGKASTTTEKANLVRVKRDPNATLPLFIVNGEEKTEEEVNQLNPDTIQELRVVKGDEAEKSYGAKGKNGVIVITTKKQ